jgi:hypothetical protein
MLKIKPIILKIQPEHEIKKYENEKSLSLTTPSLYQSDLIIGKLQRHREGQGDG